MEKLIMYQVTITGTRPTTDVPWYWDLNLTSFYVSLNLYTQTLMESPGYLYHVFGSEDIDLSYSSIIMFQSEVDYNNFKIRWNEVTPPESDSRALQMKYYQDNNIIRTETGIEV